MDVSHNRVRKIRDNIASGRSALCDVFVPFFEPLSSAALEEAEGMSGVAPSDTVGTTLSTVVVSTSSISPITIDEGSVASMVLFLFVEPAAVGASLDWLSPLRCFPYLVEPVIMPLS
ncbi:hypothetical protein Tco_0389134 [Tanacetum coccineum]